LGPLLLRESRTQKAGNFLGLIQRTCVGAGDHGIFLRWKGGLHPLTEKTVKQRDERINGSSESIV
jgi:hypothetical protein